MWGFSCILQYLGGLFRKIIWKLFFLNFLFCACMVSNHIPKRGEFQPRIRPRTKNIICFSELAFCWILDSSSTVETTRGRRHFPTDCPTRHSLLICKTDRQLRAVGSNIVHPATSSVAGPRRMCPTNRPGRLREPTLQPAKLPRGDTENA